MRTCTSGGELPRSRSELTNRKRSHMCEKTCAEPGVLFTGLPRRMTVGRYHSLHAQRGALPAGLRVTAAADDGVVMAVEHEELPVAAVQFHPESITTLGGGAGHALIANAVTALARPHVPVNGSAR
ncbi:gamma-glutamyl-gamma-aminobutyrate hydrolase family protein [Streptomyces sp. NPDC050448]|uniref:glutamine amidotransferase-related protein n=1 Tax=Streptomyces sp. NPDC050448 TaxID=3155404 RepID=UPI003435A7A8